VNDVQPLQGEPAARVLVAGASGFAGALAAQLVWRHPSLELTAVTARSDVGTRLDRLYPRYRVPLELSELDLEELGDADAAIVAYPTRRPRRSSPSCGEGAYGSSTCRPTSGCATARRTRAGTGRIPSPSSSPTPPMA
jgi:hypothetical protein